MNSARIYDFGFISKKVSRSGRPEIMLSVQGVYWLEFTKRIREVVERSKRDADTYLEQSKMTTFLLPSFDDANRYGYNSCCRMERTSSVVTIYLELCRPKYRESVLTLSHTLDALNMMLHSHALTDVHEKAQYLEVETGCKSRVLHGHAIFGEIFPVFGGWLQQHGNQKEIFVGHCRTAMLEVWNTVSDRNMKQYEAYCSAHIETDGRFFFGCFGDACDLAIYPDQASRRDLSEMRISFSSHNLDTPTQQLTLLSGLAVLVATARAENT